MGAARDPVGARALVFALVMREHPEADDRQFASLSTLADEAIVKKTRELLPVVRELGPRFALPLVDLCVPALSRLSPKFYEWFCAAAGELIDADGKMDLFEFMLQQVLIRDLDIRIRKSSPPLVRYNSVEQVAHECATLLSLIARAGHREDAAAEDAFKAGCAKLGSDVGCLGLAREAPTLSEAARTMAKLSETTPKIKKLVVEASAAATGADGAVTVEEAELLRAVFARLDVPVPPVLASST